MRGLILSVALLVCVAPVRADTPADVWYEYLHVYFQDAWVTVPPDLGTTNTFTICNTGYAGCPFKVGGVDYTPSDIQAHNGGASACVITGVYVTVSGAITKEADGWTDDWVLWSWSGCVEPCDGYVQLWQWDVIHSEADLTAQRLFKIR